MAITGNDVLKSAVAMMGGDVNNIPVLQQSEALYSVNGMLADLFDANNAVLTALGLEALETIPLISALSNEITYRSEIARNVMPYGLARDLGIPRGNRNVPYWADQYDRNKYRYGSLCSLEMADDSYGDSPTGEA